MSDAAALPRGWRWTSIGAATNEHKERVGSYEDPPTVLSSTKHHGLVPSNDFFRNRTVYSNDLSNYKSVSKNWFAYATNHLAEGSIGLQERFANACVSPIYTVFSCREEVEPNYLYRVVKSPELISQFKLYEQASVDRRGAVRYRDFAKIPLMLPPLLEQRRIARILDMADETIRSTERLIAKLEQAKQGLLYDLLTRGMDKSGHLRDPDCNRNEPRPSVSGNTPSMWSIRTLGDLVDGLRPIVYGILMPGKGEHDGVPVVKVKDISNDGIRVDDLLLTSRSIDEQYRRSRIQSGDLLFTIRGTVGRMAFVPPNLANANITQDTARISITRANKRFVWYSLQMPAAKAFIDLHTLGQAVRGINLRDVRRIPIALPSRGEQEFIVESLDAANKRIRNELKLAEALRLIRRGLTDDLLTGRVRVGISA